MWLTEWLKSENTYDPNPEAGRIIDESIDALKAFANKGGRSQAPTIILSGPGIVWHGTSMQHVATTFFRKCRNAGFPAYPSNAMWFGCSKKSSNGGVVGIERGGHQFIGLVSAFTDLSSILRREYAMNGEIQETLAIALNYLIEEGKLVNPPESYLSAVKMCWRASRQYIGGPLPRTHHGRRLSLRPERCLAAKAPRRVLLRSMHLDRRVHGIRILSPRPALIRAVGSRLWHNASGLQLHLQQVSRG